MKAEPKKPFWAKCTKCSHIWTAAYLPMNLTAMGKLLRGLCCPACGVGADKITPAKQDDGVLKEELPQESGQV